MQKALSNFPLTAEPTIQHDDSRYLAPLALCPLLPLTDDEARRGYRAFRLPTELTRLERDIYAICET